MNFEAINHDIRAAISRYYKYDYWTRDRLFIEFTNALEFMTIVHIQKFFQSAYHKYKLFIIIKKGK